MKIPTGPADLTAAWLTSALRAGGLMPQAAAVTAVEQDPLGEDEGFFSYLTRLHLHYDQPGSTTPETMIAKLSALSSEMRQRPNTRAAYEREVRFYQLMAGQISLPVPTCYYADIDNESGFHILLLEDMAPAENGSRVAGCTPEQAELAIRKIAEFHAYWWEHPQLAALDWIPDPTFDRDELTELHAEWWPEFVRQAGHKLPASLIALGERFGPHRATLFEQLWSTPPRTLTHSDFNVGNMFFASPEGGEPFTVIDWQSIGRRRGTWDVGTFLGQNLEPGVRSEIEIGLLNLYVQTLTDNGVQRYGLEQCLYDYKLCLLHRFGSLISTIAAMPFTPEQIQMHIACSGENY